MKLQGWRGKGGLGGLTQAPANSSRRSQSRRQALSGWPMLVALFGAGSSTRGAPLAVLCGNTTAAAGPSAWFSPGDGGTGGLTESAAG